MCVTAEQVFDLIERGMVKYGDLAKLHRAAQKNLPSLSYDDVRDIKRQKTKIPKADIYEALRIAVDGAAFNSMDREVWRYAIKLSRNLARDYPCDEDEELDRIERLTEVLSEEKLTSKGLTLSVPGAAGILGLSHKNDKKAVGSKRTPKSIRPVS